MEMKGKRTKDNYEKRKIKIKFYEKPKTIQ